MVRSILLAAGLVAMAIVQSQPACAQQVMILGCVSAGVEAGCLVIKDLTTGKTYNIGAAKPRPDPAQRLVVQLTGTVTDKADICQQGPVLENITWAYTKMRCMEPDRPTTRPSK